MKDTLIEFGWAALSGAAVLIGFKAMAVVWELGAGAAGKVLNWGETPHSTKA